MSITAETAKQHAKDPAVLCCRAEGGITIQAANLEDPAIFDDLVDSGLLDLEGALTIEQVLGAKLVKTCDSLTPLTAELVEGAVAPDAQEGPAAEAPEAPAPGMLGGPVPGMPGAPVPGMPGAPAPGMLGGPVPGMPGAPVPGMAGAPLPGMPGAPVPGMAGAPLPGMPGAPTSGMTVAPAPGMAGVPAPGIPGAPLPGMPVPPAPGSVLRIRIGEGRDIDIELPLACAAGPCPGGPVPGMPGGPAAGMPGAPALGMPGMPVPPVPGMPGSPEQQNIPAAAPAKDPEPKLVRSLTRKHYQITEVKRGPETKIEGTVLYIREGIEAEAVASQELVHALKIDIITPEKYHTYSDTIMDVQPIATKEGESEVGSGVTRVLDGVVMMVTGTDDNGVQIGEFGSSEGYMDENIMWNRPGAPDKGEIFIKTEVKIEKGTNMERPGPLAAHSATDVITQEIREALKKLEDESLVTDTEVFEQYRRPGKKKVIIVKEIMGQGAMHDNLILPVEPVGVLGAKPNVDLGNVPIMTSPLEVLDGCIHALTCIGPASKEMSRHYWREPLVLEALHDEEVDLCGVLFVGSPQINSEKFYVSKRVGMTVEALDVDGAFVTTEGFGNNHIDFASHIEQIGMRGIPVVGMSFCAVQGALVVGNKYMTHMIDNNKSESGIENEVLACNTLCPEDAVRAMAMLKAAMAGEEVKQPERKWNPNVKTTNVELISKDMETTIDLVENEQSLPMSQKRKEKYD